MTKISKNEIERVLKETLEEHPNGFMVASINVTKFFDKNEPKLITAIDLRHFFQYGSKESKKINFSYSINDEFNEEKIKREFNDVLNNVYFMDDYLFYDDPKDKKISSMDNFLRALDNFSKCYLGKNFVSLSKYERDFVFKYVNKDQYGLAREIIPDLIKFVRKHGRLPYDFEPLGITFKKIAASGRLSAPTSVYNMLPNELINFVETYHRFPYKNEGSYYQLYLSVLDGYRRNLFCENFMNELDEYHACFKIRGMGELIFDEIAKELKENYAFDIEKKQANCRFYNFDTQKEVKHHHKCYQKELWYYDDNNELVSSNLLIVFRGYEHKEKRPSIKLLRTIYRYDQAFDEYCNQKDIPVLIIRPKDLVKDNNALISLIIEKASELIGKPVYNSEEAAMRATFDSKQNVKKELKNDGC